MTDLTTLYTQLNSFSFTYDKENTKQLCFNDTDNHLRELLKDYNIEGEKKGGQLCIDRENLPFSFFEGESEFRQEISDKFLRKPCVIKTDVTKFLWFDPSSNTTLNENGEIQTNFHLFSNCQIYFRFIEFLKKGAIHAEGEFEFTDFYSETTRKITLASFTEKKRVTFDKTLAGIPELSSSVDYKEKYLEFEKLYQESPHYPIFLKNAVINKLYDVQEEKFKAFFSHLSQIVKEARVNFGVHLHNLSLANIVQEYKEYKQKYYESHSVILSKISSHILAMPLSVAGSAFALYKLKDSNFGLILISIAFVFFCVYFSYLVKMYYQDIKEISFTINRDFRILREQSFFEDNPQELEEFTRTKKKLDDKSEGLTNALKFFLGIFWILNIGLIIYSLNLSGLIDDIVSMMFVFSFGMFVYACVSNYIIFTQEDENTGD